MALKLARFLDKMNLPKKLIENIQRGRKGLNRRASVQTSFKEAFEFCVEDGE